MSEIEAFERSTRFAFWRREWRDIAAPIHRLELRQDQIRWLNALSGAGAAHASQDEGLVRELLDLTADGHAYRLWVGDLASGRRLTGLAPDRGAAIRNLLASPWRAVQRAVRDALKQDYPLYLNVLDEDLFPPSGWWRCLLRDGRIEEALCVMPGADAKVGRRALSTIEGPLLAGAPAGTLIADIALSVHAQTVSAGFLSAAPAPKAERLGVDLLRRSREGVPAPDPAPGGMQSDDYWVSMLP